MVHLFFLDITSSDLTNHMAQFIKLLVGKSVSSPDDFREDILDELFFELTETAEAKEFVNYLLKDLIRLSNLEQTLSETKYNPKKTVSILELEERKKSNDELKSGSQSSMKREYYSPRNLKSNKHGMFFKSQIQSESEESTEETSS